jgi:hypothetical protein
LIAWTPSTGAYGTLEVGQSVSQTFTLQNSGGSATGALAITLTGSSAFTKTGDTCTAVALGPSKTCRVTVSYSPSGAGANNTATLSATAKKPVSSASITLTGSGAAPPPNLVIGPPAVSGANWYEYSLGAVHPGDVRTQSFVVTNTGTGSTPPLLMICGSSHVPFPCEGFQPGLALTADTCTGASLAPGETCSFEVTATVQSPCFKGDMGFVDIGPFAAVTYVSLRIAGICIEF